MSRRFGSSQATCMFIAATLKHTPDMTIQVSAGGSYTDALKMCKTCRDMIDACSYDDDDKHTWEIQLRRSGATLQHDSRALIVTSRQEIDEITPEQQTFIDAFVKENYSTFLRQATPLTSFNLIHVEETAHISKELAEEVWHGNIPGMEEVD